VNQFELASLAWEPLVESAARHHLLTYQDLAQPLGLRGARPVRFALGPIQSLCSERGYPPLTSIVINKQTRLPGQGFIAGTGKLKEDHDSVFGFDWSLVPAPFPLATRTRRPTVFSKRSANPDPDEFEVQDQEVFVNGRGPFQERFKRMLWHAYGGRCCLCETKLRALLVASHIVRWSLDRQNRLNPHNGLLLCRTHDCLFETGLVRMSTQLEIEVVDDRSSVLGTDLANFLTHHARRHVRRPRSGYEPEVEFIEWSREHRVYRHSVVVD
jgi:putative restriction endonuclease